MKVNVTVEMTFDKLPDDAARELARQLVEARGLTVTRVSVVAEPNRVKVWAPKAGAPGSELVRDGRRYQVWSEGPYPKSVWAVPVDRQEGDADCVLIVGDGRAEKYHGDGKRCEPSHYYRSGTFERVETPCQHRSHQDTAAA